MMTWYTAHYGSYRNGDMVHHIDGTFDRKKMFDKAKKIANETGRAVTVIAERGTNYKTYKVKPEQQHERSMT